MKFLFSLSFLVVLTSFSYGQIDGVAPRPSPAAMAKGTVHGAAITINYSSPSVKGRTIWGGLVPYDKVWRTGANEATTFETDKNLKINGQNLPAGKYGLFTIPGEKEWTIIFNSVWDQWGAFKYDETKDVLRLNVVPVKKDTPQEQMKFEIKEEKVVLSWEYLRIVLEVK